MSELKVQLHEFNILMGNKVYLPNVSGMIQAYALSDIEVGRHYSFEDFLFIRENPAEIIKKWSEDLSVVCFSSSMWNHELNLFLAKEARLRFPESLIVFGGPHVQTLPEHFLAGNSFVDVVVLGEGEITFSEILTAFVNKNRDFSDVPGLVFRAPKDGVPIRTKDRGLVDINNLPSPYLAGLYDEILTNESYQYQVILETNRGCPFHCSFCYWGNGVTKVRNFDINRINKEIEWMARQRIPYVFGADANFGMFPRDLEIAKEFASTKTLYGWPKSFRVCYGKNAVDRVFATAQVLEEFGLTRGVTVSFQSTDSRTLDLVGRKNIKIEAYRDLLKRYRKADIRVYTELILGLPGETYESFAHGLEEIFGAGMFDQVSTFLCQALPGTEITDPKYVEEQEIETRRIELVEIHASARLPGEVKEFEDIIVSTFSMTIEDWKRMSTLAWVAQSLHGLKLGFFVSLYLFDKFNVKYVEFFEYFMEQSKNSSRFPVISEEFSFFEEYLGGILNEGKPQCIFLENELFGPISWQIEEATFLRLNHKLQEFYDEFQNLTLDFLTKKGLNFDTREVLEVFVYQQARIESFANQRKLVKIFERSIPEYFSGILQDKPVDIKEIRQVLSVHPSNFASLEDFATNVIWFGRRDSKTIKQVDWKNL